MRSQLAAAPQGEEEILVEGSVDEVAQGAAGSTKLLLDADQINRSGRWQPARFRIRLTWDGRALLRGDRLRAKVRLWPPPLPMNPGAPDLITRARSEGVAAFGTVVDGQLAVVGEALVHHRYRARFLRGFSLLVEEAVPSPPAGALIRALAVGDRAELSPEVNGDFNESGLAHILSVSGLHIAVIAAGLYKLGRWLLSQSEWLLVHTNVRALASVAAIPATWAYVALTGNEVPAVRSGIMASAIFLAMALGRDQHGLSAMSAALLAVLAYDPAALHSISFQLSFAAVAGLILLSKPLRAVLPFPARPFLDGSPPSLVDRSREKIIQAAASSLAASLATAPLVAAAFHRASLVSVVANCAALPIASALTAFSAGSAAVFALHPLAAAPLVILAEPLARALLFTSHLFASLPFAWAYVPTPSALAAAAWYALLATLLLEGRRRRLLAAASGVVLAVLWAKRVLAPFASSALTVTFLSVGQGDAALVQLPGGRSFLIDGGGDPSGRYDPGERVVLPALIELGATRLEAVALSHAHPDHALGLSTILAKLPVRELWNPRTAARERPWAKLVEVAKARQVIWRELGLNDTLAQSFAPARIEILHPSAEALRLGANDSSLVVRVSLGSISFLFPGDVEEAGEDELMRRSDLHATVLKAPHHGSKTSSSQAFVERVAPAHVVFSVGRNRFGFPHPPILDRYQRAGCEIHRTDQHGAITFRTDGKSLEIEHTLR
jgi:competence protein ComEC